MFSCASPCSKPCVFFCNNISCLGFDSVQDDSQHDFLWVADEADGAVVLALLQVSFLWSTITSDFVHEVDHSPICHILLQICMSKVMVCSPPLWISYAGMLSTPADFPFFSDLTAASTSSLKIGQLFSAVLSGHFSTEGFPLVS